MQVEVNGKAYGAGVRLGDKVIEINGRDVQNLYHTEALVLVKRATDELKMMVSRYVFISFAFIVMKVF